MNIFLDTSCLFKLYHYENDTQKIIDTIAKNNVTIIFLSELAKIEFTSTIWKKVRTLEFTELRRKTIYSRFESDFESYSFIPADKILMDCARNLVDKYGKQGLRTLDSIQLATALSLKNECELFITTDKLLDNFFKQESLSGL